MDTILERFARYILKKELNVARWHYLATLERESMWKARAELFERKHDQLRRIVNES